MPVYLSKQTSTSFLFIHIPKCGGGSIEKFFRENKYHEQLFSLNPSNLRKCSAQHMHAFMLENILNIDNFKYVFTVVRNPIARLISEYKWRIRDKTTEGGFDSWYKITRKRYLTNNFYYDNHIRPMHEFITKRCDVHKLENGMDNIQQVIESKCLDFGNTDSLWITRKIENQKKNIHKDILEKMPHLKSRFDKAAPSSETVSKIMRDYENDFKFFGYSLNSDDYIP